MNENNFIKKEIISVFGPESFVKSKLNSEFLRNKIFESQNNLKIINDLVHKEVRINFKKWLNFQSSRYILKETAILFEHKYHLDVDLSVLVTAPTSLRIQRIIKRDNISKNKVYKIIENQWDDKKKIHLSDYFIENIDELSTLKKVQKLIKVFSVI